MSPQQVAAGAAVVSLASLLLWAGLPGVLAPEPVYPIEITTRLPVMGEQEVKVAAATDPELDADEGQDGCLEQADDEVCD